MSTYWQRISYDLDWCWKCSCWRSVYLQVSHLSRFQLNTIRACLYCGACIGRFSIRSIGFTNSCTCHFIRLAFLGLPRWSNPKYYQKVVSLEMIPDCGYWRCSRTSYVRICILQIIILSQILQKPSWVILTIMEVADSLFFLTFWKILEESSLFMHY